MIKRSVYTDRTEFFAHAEVFAAMVSLEFILISGKPYYRKSWFNNGKISHKLLHSMSKASPSSKRSLIISHSQAKKCHELTFASLKMILMFLIFIMPLVTLDYFCNNRWFPQKYWTKTELVWRSFSFFVGAIQTISKLMKKEETRAAAVTMLGTTTQLCSEKVCLKSTKMIKMVQNGQVPTFNVETGN